VNWPVGVAGDFRGLIERTTGDYITFTRTPGGAGRALKPGSTPRPRPPATRCVRDRAGGTGALDEIYGGLGGFGVLGGAQGRRDETRYGVIPGRRDEPGAVRCRACRTSVSAACSTPVTTYAPPPAERPTSRANRGRSSPRSLACVFKCRPTWIRRTETGWRCPGVLRPVRARHGAHPRRHRAPFATKYAQSMFGQDRETVEEAFPRRRHRLGERHRATPGDTLYAATSRRVPPIPQLRARAFRGGARQGSGQAEAVRRGIEQLDTEGASRSRLRPARRSAPVLAAVGPLQSTWCCTGSSTSSAPAPSSITSTTRWPGAPTRGYPCAGRAASGRSADPPHDGAILALFQRNGGSPDPAGTPRIMLEPLIAG